MVKWIVFGAVGAGSLFNVWASTAGWGLETPKKEIRSVRHGSTRTRRSRHGYYFVGRGHGHYGGK